MPDPARPASYRKNNKEQLNHMPRKKRQPVLAQPVREGITTFKVRLDARTVITLASQKALEFWKQKYPQAVVIG